ncbi:hypothetical protein LUZ60_012523 [Juncus effusus]|nr:hypothetical protein LUZ60_012523 [Juncus effusus]
MVCITSIRDFIIRATTLRGFSFSASKLGHFRVRGCGRDLDVNPNTYFPQSRRKFQTVVNMMVDSSTHQPPVPVPVPVSDVYVEKNDESCGNGNRGLKCEDERLSYGLVSFRGGRPSMEDYYDVKITKIDGQRVNLFGVFDGHGGHRAAQYLKEHLFENLLNHPKFMTDTKLAIRETYIKTDSDFLNSEISAYRDDGSTASTAVLVGNQLYVANVGDSRTVISKQGKAIALSEDHKPNRIDERQRIEEAGGFIMWAGTWRVGGVLAMSRAFGNRMLKPYVVAEPDIQEEVIDEEFDLLVLATDGIWDVVPNEDVVSLARDEELPQSAARELGRTAFSEGSTDNITCIVIRFNHLKTDDPSTPKIDDENNNST